jgi:hypothetical protein
MGFRVTCNTAIVGVKSLDPHRQTHLEKQFSENRLQQIFTSNAP